MTKGLVGRIAVTRSRVLAEFSGLAIKAAHPELCKKAEQPENPEKPTTAATPATLAWAGDNPRRLAAALLKIHREDPTLQPELEKWRKQHFHLLRYKKD
jgi:hypothetical protein